MALTVALQSAPLHAGGEPRGKVKRFALQVMLGTEYGSSAKVVSRWTKAPSVSVFGGTDDQKAVVEEVFRTIGPILQPVIGHIEILPDNNAAASMKIYFAPQKDFRKIADSHGVRYREDDLGAFWMFWNSRNIMTSSFVLLASDKLSGDSLKHFAFEEITQSFGLAQDSDEFPDSIFYARGSDGGKATAPSALDLRLLAWFYGNVMPGDTSKVVSGKFDATWPKD